jgi:MoaA/NifB/PqqE/SkfB family radical SAM enzyme
MDVQPLPPRAREIALMFARTCNIACRHCGIESSPRNKSRMTLEDAKRYLVEAAAIPHFGKVTFTGGEPFLFQDEHAALLALCKSFGLETRMVTNGFWARKLDRGLAVLGRMRDAGLTELNFSADKFHLEYMDAAVLRNGLECARRLGFPRIISFVTNADTPPLDLFSEMYGVPRETLVDLHSIVWSRDWLEDNKEDHVFVYAGGLIGLGRAAQHPEELRHFPVDSFPKEPCGEVLNKPVIYPDGDFQACCCAGGKIRTFTVGNLKRESLADLYEKMEGRAQYRFINHYGPRDLFEIIARARPDRPRQACHTSICEVCVRATEGMCAEEIDDIVEAALAERTLAALGIVKSAASGREPAPVLAGE